MVEAQKQKRLQEAAEKQVPLLLDMLRGTHALIVQVDPGNHIFATHFCFIVPYTPTAKCALTGAFWGGQIVRVRNCIILQITFDAPDPQFLLLRNATKNSHGHVAGRYETVDWFVMPLHSDFGFGGVPS